MGKAGRSTISLRRRCRLIRRASPAGGAKRRCCAPNSALQRANAAVRA